MKATLGAKARAGLQALALGLTLCSTGASAQPTPAGAPAGAHGVSQAPASAARFAQRKSFTLSALTARESALAQEKACVQAATVVSQLEGCREKAKETRKDLHERVRAANADRKGDRAGPSK